MSDVPAPLAPAVAEAVAGLPPFLDAGDGLATVLERAERPSWDDLPTPTPTDPPVAAVQVAIAPLHPADPPVPARLYRRDGEQAVTGPAVLVLHGGGFVAGHPAVADQILRDAVAEHDLLVLAPVYRLAPRHPYPAAFHDARAAHRWLAERAPRHGVDPDRLVVFGFSAGACLAAGLALHARDHGGPRFARQVLASPALDDRLGTPSAALVTDPRLWNRQVARLAWDAYLEGVDREGTDAGYAIPARATDLSGLPPAVITVNDHDLLRDEGIDYARGLMRAGVRVDLHHLGGTVHGSLGLAPDAAVSRRELAVLINALATV